MFTQLREAVEPHCREGWLPREIVPEPAKLFIKTRSGGGYEQVAQATKMLRRYGKERMTLKPRNCWIL